MSGSTVKSVDLSRDLQLTLNTKPDFSARFTRAVTALQGAISEAISAPVEHDDDMNYSSAQKLVVCVDREYHALERSDPDAAFRLVDLVSSRGRFFTFIIFALSPTTAGWKEKGIEAPKRYWSHVTEAHLPEEILSLQRKIASVMESNGYTLLNGPVLSRSERAPDGT